jgi:hypothetical protein
LQLFATEHDVASRQKQGKRGEERNWCGFSLFRLLSNGKKLQEKVAMLLGSITSRWGGHVRTSLIHTSLTQAAKRAAEHQSTPGEDDTTSAAIPLSCAAIFAL